VDSSKHISDAEKLYASLVYLSEAVTNPVLVLVSGLPGTGKTYFSRQLSERLPFVILESDALRRVLNQSPNHSKPESARLFAAVHLLCERLLKEGYSVIIDATNLTEKHRRYFYEIADRLYFKLIIVGVKAPSSLVKERLGNRGKDYDSESDADWKVYLRMRKSVDKIKRKHYSILSKRIDIERG